MSMSLRNEPREPTSAAAKSTYNWQSWYTYVRQGADAIHSANADVLIFLSGLGFDTTLTPVVQGTALTPGSGRFALSDFAGYGADKLVLELHKFWLAVATHSSEPSRAKKKNNNKKHSFGSNCLKQKAKRGLL